MSYIIIQTPGAQEPSEITITLKEKRLVSFSGPMSMFAAGAFILANSEKGFEYINTASKAFKKETD